MFQKTDSHNKDKMYFFGVCIYIFFRDIFFSVKATETRDLTAFLSAEIPFKCIYLEYGRVYFAVIVYTRLPFLYIEVICLKKKNKYRVSKISKLFAFLQYRKSGICF